MARQYKCPVCDQKNYQDEMVKHTKGSVTRYYHPKCLEKHLKYQAFIDKDLYERDLLTEVIKDIHGMVTLPNSFFSQYIQMFRNGTIKERGRLITKYKKGVSYIVMRDAYLLCRKDIEWHKKNKQFKSDLAELIYGFKIMQDKVNKAYATMHNKKKQEKEQQVVHEHEIHMFENDTIKPQSKKKDDTDISDFLD